MERLIVKLIKRAEKSKNKIVIPKEVIDRLGRDYFLEVYEDYMKLVPIKKKGE